MLKRQYDAFLISGYTHIGSWGLVCARIHSADRRLEIFPLCNELENPSWIAMAEDGQTLYAVEECDQGNIAALRMEEGKWHVVRRLPAGNAPCHLTVTPDQGYLLCSNYMDGTLGVYRLDGDGLPVEQTDLVVHQGHGPDPERQEGPHVHSTLCVDELIYAADLGLDRVFSYTLDADSGKLQEQGQLALPPGSGPRHMVYDSQFPDVLYVNGELDGIVYRMNRRTGACEQKARVLTEEETGMRTSCIKQDGSRIYVGSRDIDAIVVFERDEKGYLQDRRIYRHEQKCPRDVWMEREYWCITADEGSSGLTLFRWYHRGRYFIPVSFTATPGLHPTCILPY